MRLLPATGYASAPFQQLQVDSDAYYGRVPPAVRASASSDHDTKTKGDADDYDDDDEPTATQVNGKGKQQRTSPANMLLALLHELRREVARCRDSERMEEEDTGINHRSDATNNNDRRLRRRESAPMVFLMEHQESLSMQTLLLGGNPSSRGDDNSKSKEDDEMDANGLLESVELILKSSLREDGPASATTQKSGGIKKATSTKMGCCLKKHFHLPHTQQLLNQLYQDAIDQGLYDPSNHPTTNQREEDPEDGALCILDQTLKVDKKKSAKNKNTFSQLLEQQFKTTFHCSSVVV